MPNCSACTPKSSPTIYTNRSKKASCSQFVTLSPRQANTHTTNKTSSGRKYIYVLSAACPYMNANDSENISGQCLYKALHTADAMQIS